ncbi:MAG: hypothetical protein A2Z27_05580 [candidate division Zixibacteria bacterium RBG_16_50_21]|nr:MAG: hypothetical protein A2Z27_05580 [candidate division Zixibacteria bacterium RBG_16_50_21]
MLLSQPKVQSILKLILSLVLVLTACELWAAPNILENNPDSALTLTLAQFQGRFITLDEAQNLALKNATSLQEAAANLKAAKGMLRREKGTFDPELFAEAQSSKADLPSGSPFAGALVLENEELTGSVGLRIKLPIGTLLEASLNTTKLETNSSFALLNPQYSNYGKLEITQPLLSGFGPSAYSGVSSARWSYEAARAGYQDALLSLAALVEQTYWDLYASERDLAVQILIRDQASAFLRETELRATAGQVGPNQVANAKVFLAEQEQAVLDREENLDRISNLLATLLGQRPAGFLHYRPSIQPPSDVPAENLDSLLERAFRNNRTLKVYEQYWAATKALAKGASWRALPKLDLFGSLGANGLSGKDTLAGPFDGNANQAWSQVFQRDYPTWSVGLRLSFSIGFRPGLGEKERLQGEADRSYQRYVAVKRALDEQVRAAHQELLHAKKRLEVSKSGVEASVEQVRIGLLEYQVGRTTAFELVRLGADFAAAQQRYSQSLVRAAKAAAELKRLTSENINNNQS